jgi:hypothetical protein
MTLGNMRANSVRTLAAWCLGRGCDHYRVHRAGSQTGDYSAKRPKPSFWSHPALILGGCHRSFPRQRKLDYIDRREAMILCAACDP